MGVLLKHIWSMAGFIGVLFTIGAWVFDLGVTIKTLKSLPDDVKVLSKEVEELSNHVAKIEGKLDGK